MNIRKTLTAVVIAVGVLVAQLDAAGARNFIWKATGTNGGVLYLVGSVHLLTKDFYPLNGAIESAYKDADLLVEEVDMGELLGAGSQMQMLSRAMMPSDQSLE